MSGKEEKTEEQRLDSVENGSLIQDAQAAMTMEHEMTLYQALKSYPKAVAWSIMYSMTILMTGSDQSLITNFFAYPSFREKFGNYYPGIGYQVSAPYQAALGTAVTGGAIVAIFANGSLIGRFGYRMVSLVALVWVTLCLFIVFFAPNIQVLLVGEILCNLSFGVFSIIGPAYASEVCPLALRGYLLSYVDICWHAGQLITAGIVQGLENVSGEWSYRIPFALQWMWPVPLFAILYFGPESPWWLIRKGRLEDAERAVKRLSSKALESSAKMTVALMVHTDKLESEIGSGASYLDCFKGTDLRRTEIACLTFLCQVFAGTWLASPPTYFFEQAGVAASDAYKLNVGSSALETFGCMLSWYLISIAGRRSIFFTGIACLSVLNFTIGFVALAPGSNKAATRTQEGLTLIWVFIYGISVAPLTYAIVSEISATRLRAKSICLARNAYLVGSIVASVLEPYMMNPTQFNWKGKTGFFWGGLCLMMTIWTYFRLPETKARTYTELDVLFTKRVSARKFKTEVIDAIAESNDLIDENKTK